MSHVSFDMFYACLKPGKEANFVLFSAVRCGLQLPSLGLAGERPWLAVAFSRAKKGLVVVGDRVTLETKPIWRVILEKFAFFGAIVDG